MKRKKILSALNQIDDKYIREADPATARKIGTRMLAGILAASFCLLAVFNLWLFWPLGNKLPSVAEYEGNEYFTIIEKINLYRHKSKRVYKNNFEKLSSRVEDIFGSLDLNGSGAGSAAGPENTGGGGKYEEITDNQTDGVIEGDRIKRSDTHIYYLAKNILSVYSIEGEESKKVGSFDIASHPLLSGKMLYCDEWELFLSSDCKTATVVAPYYSYENKEVTVALLSLNVEAPEAIVPQSSFTVSGNYLSSRKTENGLLLFTQFYLVGDVDFDKKETYLPKINRGNGEEFLSADSIFSPDALSSLSYTVVLKLDENGLALEGASAFLSYSSEVYVSSKNIYALRSYTEIADKDGIRESKVKTEISCLSFEDGFVHKGSFSVDGRVGDRYSLDEHEGILRVFTTLSESRHSVKEDTNGNTSLGVGMSASSTNAALYLVSLEDFSVVNKVERFAPDGETVRSARFEGDNAYVCTSIELKDPVFFFDLSDLENITYKETGTIEGFSTSLIDFGEGLLLGIGVGSFDSVKLEMYRESENGVLPFASYEIEEADYSTDYKAYYIDRENRIVGLGIFDYRTNESYYLVLLFDGYELHELAKLSVTGSNDVMRGVYIDGCFYAFGENGYAVEKIIK